VGGDGIENDDACRRTWAPAAAISAAALVRDQAGSSGVFTTVVHPTSLVVCIKFYRLGESWG